MTILHISDTHGKHSELTDLPEADILVHSGDFTLAGGDMEALDFIEWFCVLPYKHKIFIAGNHDDCMIDSSLEGLPDNVHYLSDNSVSIEGITFYGAPMLVEMTNGNLEKVEHYTQIPDEIDVLISHRPPLGILDSIDNNIHYGSASLLDKVTAIRPKLHLFGHTHDAYGLMEWKGITFCNASVTDWKYNIRHAPRILKI